MRDPSKFNYERLFFIISLAMVFVVGHAFYRMDNYNDLLQAEAKLTSYFKELKKYKENVYLPSTEVLGPSGDFIDLRDSDGKFTLLNIWATWCTPCVKELPSLKKLNDRLPYDSGWRVIAVAIDSKENIDKIVDFSTKYRVADIAGYHDFNRNLQKNVKFDKLPMTLILNKSGRILYKIEGEAFWHDQAIIDFLDLIYKVY